MARITSERILMERVVKMLPKGIPAEAIESVECDPYDGLNGGGSYWVYLADGFICSGMGCKTIHEDTLAEIKEMVKSIEINMDDSDLDDRLGYGFTSASQMVKDMRDAKRAKEEHKEEVKQTALDTKIATALKFIANNASRYSDIKELHNDAANFFSDTIEEYHAIWQAINERRTA